MSGIGTTFDRTISIKAYKGLRTCIALLGNLSKMASVACTTHAKTASPIAASFYVAVLSLGCVRTSFRKTKKVNSLLIEYEKKSFTSF